MEEKLLFKQSFYKQAVGDFVLAKAEINDIIHAGYYKKTAILERANELAQEIQAKLKTGYEELTNKIADDQQKLEEKYRNKTYSNPAEEVLRRQDFDVRLQAMSDQELLDLVEAAVENNTLSEYELHAIEIAIKEGKVKDGSLREKIRFAVGSIKEIYNIGHEWENDETYKNNEKLEAEMRLMQPNMIWLPDDDYGFFPSDIATTFSDLVKKYN